MHFGHIYISTNFETIISTSTSEHDNTKIGDDTLLLKMFIQSNFIWCAADRVCTQSSTQNP